MNIQTVNEALVSLDNYISANSPTLIFISIVVGVILFLVIFFLILRTNKTLRKQNKLLIDKLESDSKNSKIDRSLELINEFNSADFRIKVLSVLEIKLKMHENDLGDNQSIVNDAEFRYAVINCIHFFNNAGYLYLNEYLDSSIISNILSSNTVKSSVFNDFLPIKSSKLFSITGRSLCESIAVSPCPGKCLAQAITPFACNPRIAPVTKLLTV